MIKQVDRCRSCQNPIVPVLKLPAIYPSLFTEKQWTPEQWEKVPLWLFKCDDCGLVQLGHTFSPDEMYHHYWYKSSLNASMVGALRDVVLSAVEIADLRDEDTVIDIGCNDGTLLKCYRDINRRVRRIGFDPSRNLAESARENCEEFVNDYFSANTGQPRAKLITAIAMFYDLEDINGFMESILSWIRLDGVVCIQMTDLLSMMRENAWDNIVHEHLEYWSLQSLIHLCDRYGLEVFRVSTNKVNGGSLRVFCGFKGSRPVDEGVGKYLEEEERWSLYGWTAFEINLHRTIAALRSFLALCANRGDRVCALGASTKGNTLLQVIGANRSLIESIGEVSADKFGRYTVGSGIPIVPEDEMLTTDPEFILVLPWHFIDNLSRKLEGKNVVVPMPIPRLNGTSLW